MAPQLLVDRPAAGVVVVTLARPEKRNALSISLRDEISGTLDDLARDDDVKVVAVTGSGDTFCAGFDLGEFEQAFADERLAERLWASSDRYHRTVLQFPLPTIAAVNGPALGGGFDLAVMCDVRLASTTARFAHPEHAFGDVVYGPLHDIVGAGLARDLCLTGREIDADTASAHALVSKVVDPGALATETIATAERIAVAPRDVLQRTKAKALRRADLGPETATLDL